VACGVEVARALDAAALLARDGVSAAGEHVTIKPIERRAARGLRGETGAFVTPKIQTCRRSGGAVRGRSRADAGAREFVGVRDVSRVGNTDAARRRLAARRFRTPGATPLARKWKGHDDSSRARHGRSRGIGRAIASTLAVRGHAVALTYATSELAAHDVARASAATAARRSVRLLAEECASIRRAADEARARLQPPSPCSSNAAMRRRSRSARSPTATGIELFAVNLRGPFVCSQEFLPDMLKQGWDASSNISSVGGQWGGVLQVHYACAKAG